MNWKVTVTWLGGPLLFLVGVLSITALLTFSVHAHSAFGNGSGLTTIPDLCTIQDDVPTIECEALVAFYDVTGGPNWDDSPENGWLMSITPCEWRGVECQGGHVAGLERMSRGLDGAIPDLSALASLQVLALDENPRLSGSLPNNLPDSLQTLRLAWTKLTGTLPATLPLNLRLLSLYGASVSGTIPASLPNGLETLYLDNMQLEGNIPDSLPTTLRVLSLSGNRLSGTVPTAICALPQLIELDLGYNMLEEGDPCIASRDSDWAETQTVPPTDVRAEAVSSTSLRVTWSPISYTDHGGHYLISCGTTIGGPYELRGSTATAGGKSATEFIVVGLSPGNTYYCIVNAYTPPHDYQGNALTSIDSEEAVATIPSQHALTVMKQGTGSGRVTSQPGGIDCGELCKADFAAGLVVSLRAASASGSVFTGWRGDCSSAGSVVLDADRTCLAEFTLIGTESTEVFLPLFSAGTP